MPEEAFKKVFSSGVADIEEKAIRAVTWEEIYSGDDEQTVLYDPLANDAKEKGRAIYGQLS